MPQKGFWNPSQCLRVVSHTRNSEKLYTMVYYSRERLREYMRGIPWNWSPQKWNGLNVSWQLVNRPNKNGLTQSLSCDTMSSWAREIGRINTGPPWNYMTKSRQCQVRANPISKSAHFYIRVSRLSRFMHKISYCRCDLFPSRDPFNSTMR